MASSIVPSFSIASSPQGAVGGVSPTKTGRPTPNRRGPTASELLEQIRHLEAEGNKLRSETTGGIGLVAGSAGDALDLAIHTSSPDKSDFPKFSSTSPRSLSALVDITSEQKTISDLRLQLEQQKQETDRLHSQLLGDGFSSNISSAGTVMRIPSSPSRTGFSTLPSKELFSARRPVASSSAPTVEISPPSHLEKALKDSQEQVADLRRRLLEANELSEEQKRQFRQSVEELKAKLHETMANRESLLDLRQKEAAHGEEKVRNLQINIQQLTEKIRAQEEALTEASKKADGHSRESYVTETTLNQVRLILADAERKRGRPYFDTEPVSSQGAPMLVHTLERCLQELMKDLEMKQTKVEELEGELSELKQTVSTDHLNQSREHQQKITQMTVDHERQMHQASERAANARKQATNLQSQLSLIQGQHEQQLKLKEDLIGEQENKIKHLREELQEERDKWQGKREAYEMSLADTEKEMAKVRSERDEAIRNHAAVDSRIADLQMTINKQQRDLETEKENSGKYWEREGQLRSKISELETRLGEKERDVDRLERMLASVKQECNATVSEKVSSIERQERERHLDKISSLTAQLSEASEKCNKMALELDNGRMEGRDLKHQVRELTEKSDTVKIQYDAAVAEKKHLADMLNAKTSDFERVSQERDYYFNLMEQKNDELSQLKTQKERLTVQIEEKEKNIEILQQQSTNFSQMIEANSRSSESIREERDAYAKQLQETTLALEELKSLRDTMAKKMKLREKLIKNLEQEKHKACEELDMRNQELGILQQEKETLFKELKESRYEVANLSEEKDSVKRDLETQKHQLEKTVGKLQYRLKNAEQDLSLTQKALRKRETVDSHAVKVADKMQKEVTAKRSLVDSLQSRVRWFEDQVEALVKAKTSLEGDKEKLKSSLTKTLIQNQQLASELEVANSRSLDLKKEVNKLEASLEKTVVKNAASQAQVEKFEQEMTRLKLSHQLDVKEAIQKASQQKYYPNPSIQTADNQQTTGQSVPQTQSQNPQPQYPSQPTPAQQSPLLSQTQAPPPSVPASQYQDQRAHLHQQSQPVISQYYGEQHSQPAQASKQDSAHKPSKPSSVASENYKDIGSELKSLLKEMRTLISDKQENNNAVRQKLSQRQKYKPRSSAQLYRRPLTSSRMAKPSADVSYHSDAEVDDEHSRHCRTRTLTGNMCGYSGLKVGSLRSRSPSPGVNHRRSRSAEASFLTPKEVSFATISDQQMTDYSQDIQLSDFSATAGESRTFSTSYRDQSSFPDSETLPSFSQNSLGMESTKESPVKHNQQFTDTRALCQRLEEKIISLTQIGGSLQKENREMADLMKIQGRKLKKVKENEKKIRKTAR